MKKIYLFAAAFAMTFAASAQIIDDNFEFYTLGDMGDQNPTVWNNWSGDPTGASQENIIVTDAQASSGDQSGTIQDNGVQDAVLLLGDHSSGVRTLQFMMYVPSGRTGYYNFQESVPVGANWALHVHFNEDGSSGGVGTFAQDNTADPVAGESFTYPEDTWFLVSHVIDMDTNTVSFSIDGTEFYNGDFFAETGNVAGVDFFSISSNNEYYVDDVLYVEGSLGNDDFSATNFSVYPNPVQNELTINSTEVVDNVQVYDVLGKLVLNITPNAVSPKVNMGGLTSGAYFVKVSINGASKTVKVIK